MCICRKLAAAAAVLLTIALFVPASAKKREAGPLKRSEVKEAERRLSEMGFWTLITFQKWEGRRVTGRLTRAELNAIRNATPPQPKDPGYKHVEVDLDRQVLLLIDEDGVVTKVLPVSTGSGKRYKEKRLTQKMQDLSRDQFDTISEWQHLALLELMETANFKSDVAWMALRLGLDEDVVTESIERLERLDMVVRDENSNWKPTGSFTSVESKLASIAIRHYHKQLIAKGVESIEEQSIDDRDVSSTVFALSPEDIPVAKKLLREFSQKLAMQLSKNKSKDEVYCLSMQMFSLTKKV